MRRWQPANRSGGFTLLEIMLVVFVIGIIAALAMPNLVLQDDHQAMEESAEKLLGFIQLQEEEAILTGSQRGLRFYRRDEDGTTTYHYQWLVWTPDEMRWMQAPDKMRQMNGEIAAVGDLVLAVDGRPVELGRELTPKQEEALQRERKEDDKAKGKGKDDERGPTPQAIVFSSGEYTDFALTMTSADGELTLVLSGGYEGIALQDEAEFESEE